MGQDLRRDQSALIAQLLSHDVETRAHAANELQRMDALEPEVLAAAMAELDPNATSRLFLQDAVPSPYKAATASVAFTQAWVDAFLTLGWRPPKDRPGHGQPVRSFLSLQEDLPLCHALVERLQKGWPLNKAIEDMPFALKARLFAKLHARQDIWAVLPPSTVRLLKEIRRIAETKATEGLRRSFPVKLVARRTGLGQRQVRKLKKRLEEAGHLMGRRTQIGMADGQRRPDA